MAAVPQKADDEAGGVVRPAIHAIIAMEFIMLEILEAKPLAGYKLWIRFSDGRAGEVDLSHLVGKGVFRSWIDPEVFKEHFWIPLEVQWHGREISNCAPIRSMKN